MPLPTELTEQTRKIHFLRTFKHEKETIKQISPACKLHSESDRSERVIAMRTSLGESERESVCVYVHVCVCVCLCVCVCVCVRKRSEMSAGLIVDRKIYYDSVSVKEPRQRLRKDHV